MPWKSAWLLVFWRCTGQRTFAKPNRDHAARPLSAFENQVYTNASLKHVSRGLVRERGCARKDRAPVQLGKTIGQLTHVESSGSVPLQGGECGVR
jgi:hypothetical protein